MYRILCLLVLVVFHGANGQDCVPRPVEGLRIDGDSVLRWDSSSNCEETSYLIYIISDSSIEDIYQTDDVWLDVSYLPACELYQFILVAISQHHASDGTLIESTLPAQLDEHVAVTQLVAKQENDDTVVVEWNVDAKYQRCIRYYRVVYWDGVTTPQSIYSTLNQVNVTNLPPCAEYEFTVTPIFQTMREGGIRTLFHRTPAHAAHFPEVQNVRPGITYIDMTWKLPDYAENRCQITTLIVDGSPYVNITIPIDDSPERSPVRIHVEALQPDRMYLFRVTMINVAGPSRPVPLAIQTRLQ